MVYSSCVSCLVEGDQLGLTACGCQTSGRLILSLVILVALHLRTPLLTSSAHVAGSSGLPKVYTVLPQILHSPTCTTPVLPRAVLNLPAQLLSGF